jgi:hypothetical protein
MKQDPDPAFFQGSDPDLFFFKGRIRIQFEIVWIRNTANDYAVPVISGLPS